MTFESRGQTLSGELWLPSAGGRLPAVLLCHGLGSDRRAMQSAAKDLVRLGLATFAFDFTGHGKSTGVYQGGCSADVIAAYRYLVAQARIDAGRIAIVGHSMGAGAVLRAAPELGAICALALLSCPPDDIDPCADPKENLRCLALAKLGVLDYPRYGPLPWVHGLRGALSRLWMRLRGYHVAIDWSYLERVERGGDLSQALARLEQIPVLFVHCRGDMLSPYQNVVKLSGSSRPPKQLLLHPSGFHAGPLALARLRRRWTSWLASLLLGQDASRVGSWA
ncbi:MAG: alpha/beta fold hydrolase [Chloroflexi bacterium]|nr:alpha/beta fold hydrolase [Chloroflexota bacterium]